MKEIARRDALQAVAGLASVAAVGTVAGRVRSGSAAPSRTALDAVPASADALVSANCNALRRDDGLRALTDAALRQRAQYQSDGVAAGRPRDVDTLLADIEANFQTDPEKIRRATAFGDVGSEGAELFGGYGGVVLRAELSADDVKSGFENLDNIAFTELEASETVVYEPDSANGPWVGALGSDRVVVGTEAAVYDVVDVTNGEERGIDDPVRDAYRDAREAPVRFAGRLPDPSQNDAVPTGIGEGAGPSVDLTPLDQVTTLSGTVYGDGDVRGLEVTLDATGSAAARDVASVVRTLRDRVEAELGDAVLADIVGDLRVERDGSTVTASVERTVSELESLVDGS